VPELEQLSDAIRRLADEGLTPPAEPIPVDDTRNFWTPPYGLRQFGQLFSPRQQVTLLTLCQLVRQSHAAMIADGLEPKRARAIATYFGMLIDRMADRGSTLCHWQSNRETVQNTFSRQALPMVWDFPEANPFGGASGDLRAHLAGIVKVIESCASSGAPVRVMRGSASELPFEDSQFDVVLTDPPYYDNISYADLSDFFYVWLKRSIGFLYPEHLGAELTPKRVEIIAAPYRQGGTKEGAKAAYEELMGTAFREAHRVLRAEGILVCVYAHQTTAGWATLIEAVRHAGFEVSEAWPLDTEMGTRGIAQGTAALASSIFLVARPRQSTEVGDWAHDVRPELERIVRDRVEALSNLGVTGTDLVIAAIGAGMRAYTRFGRVEKPNGEELEPDEYLDEVEREVAETILAKIFQTDRSGLGRVDQETQFYVMGRFEFEDALAPWDELNTLARGTGVELKELTLGDSALVVFGKKRSEARLRDYLERGEEIEVGRGTIDHLHRVLWLAENAPDHVKEYLDVARPDADRLRLVAHALSRPGLDTSAAQNREAEACERLLASFKRLVEDNLFTGSA
jgi:putative DNA methylase